MALFESAFGIEPYRRLAGWLQAPQETLIAESGFMGIGFLLTTGVDVLSDAICVVALSSPQALRSLRVGACMSRGAAFS